MSEPSSGNQESDVVVITGASRGLGLGLACLLAARGVRLVLTARDPETLERVGSRLSDLGNAVKVHAGDVADESEMDSAFRLAQSLGPLVGVVNNAGLLDPVEPISRIEPSEFDAHFRTNVTGVLVGTKMALRHRTPERELRIVNVSSGAATHGYRGWAAYCASKAAVNVLTEVASLEAGDRFTSVVAVAPGVIETRMQRIIRATPASSFPNVSQFVEMKKQGALLGAVEAAVTLEWLVRAASLGLTGQFLDGRSGDTQGEVQRYRAAAGQAYEDAYRAAEARFHELERPEG